MANNVDSKLIYPVYLNAAMVKSFSAALNEGDSSNEGSGFIGLREALLSGGQLAQADQFDEKGFDNLQNSQLLEVSGVLRPDYIQQAMSVYEQAKPTTTPTTPAKTQAPSRPQPGANRPGQMGGNRPMAIAQPEPEESDGSEELDFIINTIKRDLHDSPVQDVVLTSTVQYKGTTLSVVIPLIKSQLAEGSFETVRFTELTVVGKIIGMNLGEGEAANLLRRSIFGYLANEVVEPFFGSMLDAYNGLNAETGQTQASLLQAPWIEILPLAIYI